MRKTLFHLRREFLTSILVQLIYFQSWVIKCKEKRGVHKARPAPKIDNPNCPEDFRPLENDCFQDPFDFYKMIRDDYPVYELPNGVICISRYQDIVDVSRDVEHFSSAHQGIVAGLKKGQDLLKEVDKFDLMSKLGLIPADVLATSDQPKHTVERKVGHSGLNSRFVKSLEGSVETLCREMMDNFIPLGKVEFMAEFGWRLPMILIIRLLGLPDQDFEKIKVWCVHGINSQSGISSKAELATSQAEVLQFLRYCWRKYLKAKKMPQDNLIGSLIKAADDPDTDFGDKEAVSAIFQLLIAGSDSSATSMGNALKMLIENPELQAELRTNQDKIPAFIEEVFRLEAAFQGHFRWIKKATQLHGVNLPIGSRIFLMWASGNRDERFWQTPNEINLNRKNAKKHLTFGHGIHACIGRELARMEIKIVLREFLTRTANLQIDGEAPFIASMFARTLLHLPIRFDLEAVNDDNKKLDSLLA